MDDDTRRVELSNGNWALVEQRPVTGKDIRAQAQAQHERGYAHPALDGFVIASRFVKEWSLGAVTVDALEELSMNDINTILDNLEVGEKAASTSSSDGGSAKVRTGRRRSTGG